MRAKRGKDNLRDSQVPAVIITLFEGKSRLDEASASIDKSLEGAILKLMDDGEIKGKKGELTVIHTFGKMPAGRVIVAGLGKKTDFNTGTIRDTYAAIARKLQSLKIDKAATKLIKHSVRKISIEIESQSIIEGWRLGSYRFLKHKHEKKEALATCPELTIIKDTETAQASLDRGIEAGNIASEACMLSRDMVNEPSNLMTPTDMAAIAKEIAENSAIETTILEKAQCEKMGMSAFLGVAKGSTEAPKMIIMNYLGDPKDPTNNIGLIGKGITFDSGGISIKPSANMGAMKGDMGGGASIISAMKAISSIGPKINVTGIIPTTENMPSGSAQKPGDVVTAMNGKTIEIDNTDAEGRLILADAICYAKSLGLTKLIDVATLTGAISIALGDIRSGLFSNNDNLTRAVMTASEATGERMWRMPLDPEYQDKIKSLVADVKNTGGRGAGSVTAARFLLTFVEETPWVHIDIAGTSMIDSQRGYEPKGATGVPVRTIIETVISLAKDT